MGGGGRISWHYQSWARDNTAATTWPWFQATTLFVIAILLYFLWLLLLDTKTLIFFTFVLVFEALLCCSVVVVAKLKNCPVPSSGHYAFNLLKPHFLVSWSFRSDTPTFTKNLSLTPWTGAWLYCVQYIVMTLSDQLWASSSSSPLPRGSAGRMGAPPPLTHSYRRPPENPSLLPLEVDHLLQRLVVTQYVTY